MSRDYAVELAAIQDQQRAVLVDQAKDRGNKKFKCVWCDKLHTISKCDAFTFPKWESGSGYDDGTWWEGQIYVLCPDSGKYNRCYFESPPYGFYSSYDHNAEMQFKRIYKSLFKSLTEGKDNKELGYSLWNNNLYFDQNHDKFGLKVKGS